MIWSRIQSVVRRWLHPEAVERQIDAELRSYLQHQIDSNVAAGMSAGEARRQALLDLGGHEQVKEHVRRSRSGAWLDSVLADVRYAARIHAKRPGFTAVAILTLGLGIGAATTTFSMMDTVLLRPLPYKDPEQLVEVWAVFPDWRNDPTLAQIADEMSVPLAGFQEWKERQTVFQDAAMFATFGETTLTGSRGPQELCRGHASHNLFSLLGVSAERGRLFDPNGGPEEFSTVILSHDTWLRVFGEDEEAIGSAITLNLDGQESPFTVIGVLPPDFDFRKLDSERDPSPQIWLSMEHDAAPEDGEIVARLEPRISIAQAREETARLFAGISYSDLAPTWMLGGEPPSARVVSRHAGETAHTRTTLFLLFGSAGLLLTIAAGNVANLIVGRAVERENEVAMRAALGASRWRLLRQLGTESMLLVLASGVAGTLLASWGIDAARGWLPEDFPRAGQLSLDLRVLLFAIAACALAGLVFSLAPALRLRGDLDASLRQSVRRLGGARTRLQGSIVVVEVALSFVLLVGGALLAQSLVHLTSVELGLRIENVLAVPVTTTGDYLPPVSINFSSLFTDATTPEERIRLLSAHRSQLESFRHETELAIGSIPGVRGVAASGPGALFEGGHNVSAYRIGSEPGEVVIESRDVSANYFEVLGIPFLGGRTFSSSERAGEVVVINRALAERFWPNQDPVGRMLDGGGSDQQRRIVGVVENVREFGFREDVFPIVYHPIDGVIGQLPTFLVRTTGDPLSLSEEVRAAIWSVDDQIPIGTMSSLESLLAATYVAERQRTGLIAAFAFSAAGLALVGLYGVISRFVTYRSHELSVRAALGARAPVLLKMVLGHGAGLALAGIAIGAAGALAGTRLIAGFLFGIEPVDGPTYLVIALGVLATALLASYIPARRAAVSDPMTALRAE